MDKQGFTFTEVEAPPLDAVRVVRLHRQIENQGRIFRSYSDVLLLELLEGQHIEQITIRLMVTANTEAGHCEIVIFERSPEKKWREVGRLQRSEIVPISPDGLDALVTATTAPRAQAIEIASKILRRPVLPSPKAEPRWTGRGGPGMETTS